MLCPPLRNRVPYARHRRVVSMAESIGTVATRLMGKAERSHPKRQPNGDFWRALNSDLKAARTAEEQEAVWQRYASEQWEEGPKPNRRQRRGATVEPVKYRKLDRNQ